MSKLSTMFVVGPLLALVAACGGNEADENVARFVKGCLASTNLDSSFCECAAENAREELSADGFAFVTATFDDNEQAIAMVRNKLDPAEAMAAGMFMVNAYKKCAKPTD